MSSDGADNILTKRPHSLDGIGGGAVLEDDLETGILVDEVLEHGQELGLSVHDGDTLAGVAGDFAVEVEDDALFFHRQEDLMEGVE